MLNDGTNFYPNLYFWYSFCGKANIFEQQQGTMIKATILIFSIVFSTVVMADVNNASDNFFEAADAFFKTYVTNGRVDYADHSSLL